MNMGLTAENLALRYRIRRKQQDEFALRSHQRPPRPPTAANSPTRSLPTWGRDCAGRKTLLTQDECIRRDTSAESLAGLKPAFMPEGAA